MSRIKFNLSRFIASYLLPLIVPILLSAFVYFCFSLYQYFEHSYRPQAFEPYIFSQSEEGIDFFIDAEIENHVVSSLDQSGTVDLTFNNFRVEINEKKIGIADQFCIEDLIIGISTTATSKSLPGKSNQDPVCLNLDASHFLNNADGIYKYNFKPHETSLLLSVGSSVENNSRFYPLDSQTMKYTILINYILRHEESILSTGILSPSINFEQVQNNLYYGWETHLKTEKETIDANQIKNISANLLNTILNADCFIFTFTRPFAIKSLYISVFTVLITFVGATFFIKDTNTYLASMLAILLGLFGIKQLIALPPNILSMLNIIDPLVVALYVLIGISGVNFIIDGVLNKKVILCNLEAAKTFKSPNKYQSFINSINQVGSRKYLAKQKAKGLKEKIENKNKII